MVLEKLNLLIIPWIVVMCKMCFVLFCFLLYCSTSCGLKAQCVTFTCICWHKLEYGMHIYFYKVTKNKYLLFSHSTITSVYIYINSLSAFKEAVILCHRVSTIPSGVSWFYPGITSGMRTMWGQVGHQETSINIRGRSSPFGICE